MPHADLVPSTDVEFNWQAVNSTPGAVCIGASMPVGQYVAEVSEGSGNVRQRWCRGAARLACGQAATAGWPLWMRS